MSLEGFLPIDEAPRDGTPVLLACETNPELGTHLMMWSSKNKRWEGWAFAVVRKVRTWWDEAQPQPTHFKMPG
jgi:hypothetical protein